MSTELQKKAKREGSIPAFLYRQFFLHPRPAPITLNLAGRTAIVTGSNTGLGLEAVRQMLDLGLTHAILAVRSPSKGDTAAVGLLSAFPSACIEVWTLDMASYASIRAFVKRCESLPRIDIVILNAGLQCQTFGKNLETGHEVGLQVNFLSTMLLTILLLPVLRAKRSALDCPARLTAVTSETMFWFALDATEGSPMAKLDSGEKFDRGHSYANAKLLLMLSIAKVAEYVDAEDVIVNAVNPGMCAGTELVSDILGDPKGGVGLFFFKKVYNGVARPASCGASTYLDAAIVQGKESHGSYCSDWRIKPYPPLMYTEDGKNLQERLWKELMECFAADRVADIVAHLRR
jgi:NAD(P)-dependent dehydrogenase (short-subunit alcohol dehydrogenase family)